MNRGGKQTEASHVIYGAPAFGNKRAQGTKVQSAGDAMRLADPVR